MKKTTLVSHKDSLENCFRRLANAIAATIEHEDCPTEIYNAFIVLVTDWENSYQEEANRKEEAKRIRKVVPFLLLRAAEKEKE